VVDRISASFRDAGGAVDALGEVSFRVAAGEFLCLLGPSGCGKTTLLRILAGLLEPTTGAVYLDSQQLSQPDRRVGMVFQQANLMPWRTVLRNVALPLEVSGVSRREARQRAEALVWLVGLEGFEDSYPQYLSGGMQQRVAIARALVQDPAILLLDEPFGALDAITRERMNLELLRIWDAQRKTVVMVTHNIQEAIFLADRVLVLSSQPGRVVLDLPISLPRPRRPGVIYSPVFSTLSFQLHEAIR
jgi:NitT/TauT family transport system ATP-binding protein